MLRQKLEIGQLAWRVSYHSTSDCPQERRHLHVLPHIHCVMAVALLSRQMDYDQEYQVPIGGLPQRRTADERDPEKVCTSHCCDWLEREFPLRFAVRTSLAGASFAEGCESNEPCGSKQRLAHDAGLCDAADP